MNPFKLLLISLPNVVRLVAYQNDKTRVYSAYVLKIFFAKEPPRISRMKVHFDEAIRTTRINPNIPHKFYECYPHDCITIDEK